MATNKDGSEAARDWLTQSGAPRGKELAEMAGLDPDSKEARNFIRAIQLFTTDTGKRKNETMSDKNLELLAEAASSSELGVKGTVTLPRDTNPKKWRDSDTEPRQIALTLDPAIAITQGYEAAFLEQMHEDFGEDIDELLLDGPHVDGSDVDWQL